MADASAADPRLAAARAVAAVFAGRSLDDALPAHEAGLTPIDRSFARALVHGVLREHALLEALASRLIEKPLRNEPQLQALLLCGLYQLRAMRVPPHAAVGETVAATAALGKPWAKGLFNAVLRRYAREREVLDAALPPDAEVRLSYPAWLVQAIRSDWPGAWRTTLAAGNEPGPLVLRVNSRRGTRADALRAFEAAGLVAQAVDGTEDAIVLADAVPVEQLPGFAEGRVSVQDASAQYAATLLEARPGDHVLDACAAPGGKTAHLLERIDALEVLALDLSAARLARVQATLERLGLAATLLAADAAKPSTWWDGRAFDRILLDAPCSGTGVIRRHPDIKWLRRESDIPAMAEVQQRLLRALWPLLRPGGTLIYATCSILAAEGVDVVEAFLANHADAEEKPIEAPFAADGATGWGEPCRIGRRIAPGGAFDGFYYAVLHKR